MKKRPQREDELADLFEGPMARRATALATMPEPLREKIRWIEDWFKEDTRHNILSRYELGSQIVEVYDDVHERQGGRYGARAVEEIKRYFDWDRTTIYIALAVASVFTREEVVRMAAIVRPNGSPIPFGYLVHLADVEDTDRRETLLSQAVAECWTCNELHYKVRAIVGEKVKPTEERGGRPMAVPKNFDAVLVQQTAAAENFFDRSAKVWSDPEHSLVAYAKELSDNKCTEELAEQLKVHLDKLQRLAQEAKSRADEAQDVYERIRKRLEKRKAVSRKVDDAADEAIGRGGLKEVVHGAA